MTGRPSKADFTNPATLADLISFYTQGASASILARHYQCAPSTVVGHLRAAGITIRPRGGASRAATSIPAALAPLLGDEPDPAPKPRRETHQFIDMPWFEDALCRREGDPEAFYPEGRAGWRAREAKKVCARCTVIDQCRTWALENHERWGVWGGLSEPERRAIFQRGADAIEAAKRARGMSTRNNPHGHRVPTIGTVIPPRDERDWVTTSELIDEARITYRQADYWTRTGVITPLDKARPGSGIVRRYSVDQIARASAYADLLDAGVSLTVARLVIDQLLATGQATHGHVTFHLNPSHRTTASTGAQPA